MSETSEDANKTKFALKILSRANPSSPLQYRYVDAETGAEVTNLDEYYVLTQGDFKGVLERGFGVESGNYTPPPEGNDEETEPTKSSVTLSDLLRATDNGGPDSDGYNEYSFDSDGNITFTGKRTADNGYGYIGDTVFEKILSTGVLTVAGIANPVMGVLGRLAINANNVAAVNAGLKANGLDPLTPQERLRSLIVGPRRTLEKTRQLVLSDVLKVPEVEMEKVEKQTTIVDNPALAEPFKDNQTFQAISKNLDGSFKEEVTVTTLNEVANQIVAYQQSLPQEIDPDMHPLGDVFSGYRSRAVPTPTRSPMWTEGPMQIAPERPQVTGPSTRQSNRPSYAGYEQAQGPQGRFNNGLEPVPGYEQAGTGGPNRGPTPRYETAQGSTSRFSNSPTPVEGYRTAQGPTSRFSNSPAPAENDLGAQPSNLGSRQNTGYNFTSGKTVRDSQVQPAVEAAISDAAKRSGVSVSIYSGGQISEAAQKNSLFGDKGRVPGSSTRHDWGGAADLTLHDPTTGRALDSRNPEDREKMANFMTEAVSNGLVGVGHHPGYMGTKGIHVGLGDARAWGNNARSANTPGWVKDAWDAGMANQRGLPPVEGLPVPTTSPMDRNVPQTMQETISNASPSTTTKGLVDSFDPNAPMSGYRGMDTAAQLTQDLANDPDLGLTPEQAAGIVGNFYHETAGFTQPEQIQGPAMGWAQWEGARKNSFQAETAKRNLDLTSYNANYSFLKDEALGRVGTEKKNFDAVKNSKSARDAALTFMTKFERPGIPHVNSRLDATAKVFDAFGNLQNYADNLKTGYTERAQSFLDTGFLSGSSMLGGLVNPFSEPAQEDYGYEEAAYGQPGLTEGSSTYDGGSAFSPSGGLGGTRGGPSGDGFRGGTSAFSGGGPSSDGSGGATRSGSFGDGLRGGSSGVSGSPSSSGGSGGSSGYSGASDGSGGAARGGAYGDGSRGGSSGTSGSNSGPSGGRNYGGSDRNGNPGGYTGGFFGGSPSGGF